MTNNYPPTRTEYFFIMGMYDDIWKAYFYPNLERHTERFKSGNFFLSMKEAESYQRHCHAVSQLQHA